MLFFFIIGGEEGSLGCNVGFIDFFFIVVRGSGKSFFFSMGIGFIELGFTVN